MLARSTILIGMLALLVAACDRPANPTGEHETFTFLPAAPSGTFNAQIQPPALPVIPTPIGGCTGFSTNFNLIIEAPGHGLFLDQLGLAFFDVRGVAGVPVFFSSADLTGMFGTTVIAPGVVRTFPVSPRFGCGLSATATLVATFVLRDETGSSHKMELTTRFAH